MKLALAIGVIAVAFSAALYIHQRNVPHHVLETAYCADSIGGIDSATDENSCVLFRTGYRWIPAQETTSGTRHPSWEDPVALLLALGSVAVAIGIARPRW